jgi:hypothetical protein
MVNIELYPDDGKNPGPSVVLMQIDNKMYIVDSYGGYRKCEYRIFEQLLLKSNILVWNKLFRSREINKKEYSEIRLEIIF